MALRICLLLTAVLQLQIFAAESPWQRVVVVGASASAGFVLSEPFGGPQTDQCKLNHFLDAAIITHHAPVANLSSALMFMNPDAFAPMQINAVTNTKPTLVIGVDFLFWFCYGDGNSDAERAERFESGLKLLEKIPCPLVVGDIPDASYATNTGIISVDQVPSEAARQAANKRLMAWASKHPHVTVMPLAGFMRAAMANSAMTIHGHLLPAGKTRGLLQSDQLHPNQRGAAVLALGILDSLVKSQKKFSAGDVDWKLIDTSTSGQLKK
jgi:hypothetical protein